MLGPTSVIDELTWHRERVIDAARNLSRSATRDAVYVEAVCSRIAELDRAIAAEAAPCKRTLKRRTQRPSATSSRPHTPSPQPHQERP